MPTDPNNPPTTALPVSGADIATAGTAEAALGTDATGGTVPWLQASDAVSRRVWSYDTSLNTAERQAGDTNQLPDCVEQV